MLTYFVCFSMSSIFRSEERVSPGAVNGSQAGDYALCCIGGFYFLSFSCEPLLKLCGVCPGAMLRPSSEQTRAPLRTNWLA